MPEGEVAVSGSGQAELLGTCTCSTEIRRSRRAASTALAMADGPLTQTVR